MASYGGTYLDEKVGDEITRADEDLAAIQEGTSEFLRGSGRSIESDDLDSSSFVYFQLLSIEQFLQQCETPPGAFWRRVCA